MKENRQGYQPTGNEEKINIKNPPVGGGLIKSPKINIDELRLEIATEILINNLNNKSIPQSQLEGAVDRSVELANMLIEKVGFK